MTVSYDMEDQNSSLRHGQNDEQLEQSRHAERARSYANCIIAHANRGQDRHLFCGSHFRALNDLVFPSTATISSEATPFDYIVSRDFGGPTRADSAHPQLATFDAASAGLASFASLAHPEPQNTRVLFVRGHPSADWINSIGSQYRIDIEYFRQKLRFLEDKDYYDLPSLPSNSHNIFHLRISTIYKRQTALSLANVHKLRQSEKKAVWKHQRSLNAVGESIVRQVSIFDETSFAVEQDVSIYIVNKRGRSSTAIVWLDAGRDLPHTGDVPWEAFSDNGHKANNDPLPTIQKIPSKILASMTRPNSSHGADYPYLLDNLPPSTSHLSYQYGLTLDPRVAAVDLGYALSELLLFAACGEVQFLNLIERRVTTLMCDFDGQETFVLDELNYAMRLLQDHLHHISDVRSFLEYGAGSGTGVAQRRHVSALDEEQQQRPSEALQAEAMLIEDIKYLSQRTKALITQARDGMNFVSNGVMLEESRQAIGKADRLERLTLLAFFFLPLSLTTSFFGSNFRELGGTGDVSVWVMFVTLFPVMALAAVLCFWDYISVVEWSRILAFCKK